MKGEKQEQQLHVALLPWLAFGHLNPFLQIAVALADAGLRITYLSTPRNTRRLLANHHLPPHISSKIRFVDLSLPSVEGLPENAEATVDLTAHEQNPLFKLAYDRLRDQIKSFLLGHDRPDYLIYDLLTYWAPAVALDAGGVPCLLFSIFPSSFFAFLGWPPECADVEKEEGKKRWFPSPESLMSVPEWINIPTKMSFRRWEAEMFYQGFFGHCCSGISMAGRYVQSIGGSEGAIVVRCCNEYNGVFLDMLPSLYGKSVIPVGWLPPTVLNKESSSDAKPVETIEWLNRQPPKSVVFVSFGSEYNMSRVAVLELAYGLEMSNIPFLWVLRRPAWLASDEEDEKALPDGFRSRIQGRGFVSFGWAPQLKIFAHQAVGGTLFHVGWSSVIESLSYGLVLVLLPGVIEQGPNARLIVEKGLGVEVDRDEDDGSFDRFGVAKALRTAMASEETERLRKKAGELSAVLGDRTVHDNYINQLIDFMAKSCESKKQSGM